MYATSGKNVLPCQELAPGDRAAVQHTTRLPGAPASADSVTDPVCGLKIRMCMFISQPLVHLCRELAEDKNALTRLSVSNQHVSYVNTHGIAPEFKKRLSEKLKNCMFSLNIDEASSQSMDSILHVLVRFFDYDQSNNPTYGKQLILPRPQHLLWN